ncbi:MAG: IS200/IS605 family transposase [Bacteroidota bacterium]
MPFVKIWIHLIFSTKGREKIIYKELKEKLIDHIKVNAKEKQIWIDSINGTSNHLHLLISLGTEQTISKVAMLLKGESSYWINKNKLTRQKFEWQDEYIAISVSESVVEKVRKYISDQEEHHKKKSFGEEYGQFLVNIGHKIIPH